MHQKPTKIMTIATTGLVIALPMAKYLQVPVVYARKERNVVMADTFRANYASKTVGSNRELLVSKSHIDSKDRILVVDDFLSSGAAQEADAIDKLRRNCAKALGLSQVPLAFGKDKTLVGGEMSHPSISPQNKTARNKTVRYEKLAGYTGTSPINLFNAFLNKQVSSLSALEAEERGKTRTRKTTTGCSTRRQTTTDVAALA